MARKISVEIVGDARSLEKAFQKSSKSAKRFQGDMDKTGRSGRRAFGGLGRVAGFAAGAIGTAGLIGVARTAFGEFSEAQKVTAQTNAVLKSTGKAANVTAKHVDELADSTLRKTGIDDEATKAAENWLLSFTNIRNEAGKNNKIFDRATASTADLATAMADGAVPSSEQMVQASKLLGKALNDPAAGLTALKRAGIGFTDQQKDQIKAAIKHNDVLKAQDIILDEVVRQTGGRAVAAGKTFSGQWRIMTETINNLLGTLAAKLMPTIQRYLQQAVKWLNNTRNQKRIIDAVTNAAQTFASVLRTLQSAFRTLANLVGGNENAIKALVAAYATFQVVSIAGSVVRLAASFGGVTTALTSPVGLVAAAGLASFGLTTLLLKVTGLDKKLQALGGTIYDVATRLHLFGATDPMAQFAGKKVLTPGMVQSLRGQATRLRRRGIADPAAELARRHPALAARDIQVAIGLHMRGGNLVPQVEQQVTKRAKQRPHRRRGAR